MGHPAQGRPRIWPRRLSAVAGPPEPIVRRRNNEINAVPATPEMRDGLSTEALDPMPMAPARFGQHIAADIAKRPTPVRERKLELG